MKEFGRSTTRTHSEIQRRNRSGKYTRYQVSDMIHATGGSFSHVSLLFAYKK